MRKGLSAECEAGSVTIGGQFGVKKHLQHSYLAGQPLEIRDPVSGYGSADLRISSKGCGVVNTGSQKVEKDW